MTRPIESDYTSQVAYTRALEAYCDSLVQPKQAPEYVAVINVLGNDWKLDYLSLPVGKHRLYAQQYSYTTPPKREWVDLTDDDLVACSEAQKATVIYFLAKLKKKNT